MTAPLCKASRLLPDGAAYWERPVFVHPSYLMICKSCAGARPQVLVNRFCTQNLQLTSETAFESSGQMTGTAWQGFNLGLKIELCRLTSSRLATGFNGFNPLKPRNRLC